jgi:hypothetical protein
VLQLTSNFLLILFKTKFMKNLNFISNNQIQGIIKKVACVFGFLMWSIASLHSQTYDPKNGFTYYPNGAKYICNCVGGYGPEPVVIGPDGETVGCNTNEPRCKEILEEADDDAAAGGGDNGGEETTEANPQSLTPEIRLANAEYKKQLKIKYGVWAKQNGKWIYANNPREWTHQIIKSWKKSKK